MHLPTAAAASAGARAHAAYTHLLSLAADPAPLFAALVRAMAVAACGGGGAAAATGAGAGAAAAAAGGATACALVAKLQPLVAAVIAQGVAGPVGGGTPRGSGSSSLVEVFAGTFLLAPGACAQVSEEMKVSYWVWELWVCGPDARE